jgi:hypothetical protein
LDRHPFIWSLADTPGLLNREDHDRNKMELLTLTVLQHLPSTVIFVVSEIGLHFCIIFEGVGHSCFHYPLSGVSSGIRHSTHAKFCRTCLSIYI